MKRLTDKQYTKLMAIAAQLCSKFKPSKDVENYQDALDEAEERTMTLGMAMTEVLIELPTTVDVVADIEEFHEKFELTYDGAPRVLPTELAEFRRKFLKEELEEYKTAAHRGEYQVAIHQTQLSMPGIHNAYDPDIVAEQLEKMLDALVDLVYVAVGTSYLQGFDFREAWRRVHAANMRKVRAERAEDSKRGSTYDVIKPEGWTPPDHSDLVEAHAHRAG